MHTFLDQATIFISSGDGGAGAMHFRHEKYVPLGGPDGGDGGHGGSVFLRADKSLNTLFSFKRKRRFTAEAGGVGGPSRMHGANGDDLTIAVPVGTVVRVSETGEVLADLREDGDTLLVANGGKGGLGNVHFKSSTHQAPRFSEKGEPGRQMWLELELKVIADVGLIGMPNAGKSTLLSVISAARPKVAGYPFTTLTPNLGVVDVGDGSFVAADIPGLIEGAHEGVGLGHEFLRHIERTLVLVHVVDGSADDPLAAFEQVNEELRQYDEDLMLKPQIVAVNKMDLVDVEQNWSGIEQAFQALGYEAMPVSAATREGIDALMYRASSMLTEQVRRLDEVEVPPPVIQIKPPAEYFQIERKRRTFQVHGEEVERLAVMTDLESAEAVHRLQRRLKRAGLFTALQRAGIEQGARVRIGEVEFAWGGLIEPDLRPLASQPLRVRDD